MVRPEIKKKRRELATAEATSRKARKRMEKIVLHKKNKIDRNQLLAQLKRCQLEPGQLEVLHSTTQMQTKGLKRFLGDDGPPDAIKLNAFQRADQCLDASKLLRRRRRKRAKFEPSRSSASSSEDTDAISTDTEEYYESADEQEVQYEEPQKKISNVETPTLVNGVVEQLTTSTVIPPLSAETQDHRKSKPEPSREPAVFVEVVRPADVETSRLALPIIGEEQNIMETIRYNDIVLISGETGSGKTTQLPQFLYEAGYALDGKIIGVTEPRRVAAVSMSERVAHELNLKAEDVSYQIRFSGNVSSNTKIKFMTDGVLLRECQHDFLLNKYSVIIIDEAHERSVFSDILIGLLSRIVPLRAKRDNPLKLIIMSATLRLNDFTENTFLFKQPPPIINIEARQFPVTINFAKKTPPNYLQAAYRKVCSLHSKMPKGGILVFVTSQMDVKVLVKKLRQKFPGSRGKLSTKTKANKSPSESRNKIKINKQDGITLDNLKEDIELEDDVDQDINDEFKYKKMLTSFDDWSDQDSASDDDSGVVHCSKTPLHCLGLYAMLPLEKQRLVFKEPPAGTRLCVIATNVAETSITIPNIKYVVDTGMEKTKVYDLVTGVSKFVTTWTSKSSAQQRTGRAGRMGPGQCFRLYSSAVFANDFADHAEPSIMRKPVEDVLLQMKSMNIDNVVNFPFPTRPSLQSLMAAEKKLITLGALDDSLARLSRYQDLAKNEFSSRPTALGKAMASFALGARCSKMIVLSPADLLSSVICLVSALTVREIFIEGNKWRELRKKWAGRDGCKLLGDYMVMLKAVIVADSIGPTNKRCLEKGLRTKAILEIDKLRRQLTTEINSNLNYPVIDQKKSIKRPTDGQSKILRQLLLSSMCDHVARKVPDCIVVEKDPQDPNKTIRRKLKHAYECMDSEDPVYISPESVLKGEHQDFIIYNELYKGDKKTYMRDVAVIEPEWLPHYAFKLCNFSETIDKSTSINAPRYDSQIDQIICTRSATYGPLNWTLGSVDVPMHLIDAGAEIYKYFACFLLSGEVVEWFKKYASKLLSPPTIMTKPWSKLQPRTSKILQVLAAHSIKSKKEIQKMWHDNPDFLKCEYLAWLPEHLHSKVTRDWEQLVSQ